MVDPFQAFRTRLLSLAYRILGSFADAEDAVQDAQMRWLALPDPLAIESPHAWAERVVTNRCLDVLKSARVQRETYVGPWLPEPVATDRGAMQRPAVNVDDISLAFLTLLERLSPLERAVYVLAEAFDYSPDEIAGVLDREPAAVRQLLHRGREHVRAGRPRFAPDRERHQALLGTFLTACAAGDVAAIERVLTHDCVARTDGGGHARAALREVRGANRVARFFVGVGKKNALTMEMELREVNGWPALVGFVGNEAHLVLEIETDGDAIFSVSLQINPAKLKALSR